VTDRKWVIYTLMDDLGFGMAELARAVGYPVAALRAFRFGALQEQDQITFEDIRFKLHDIAVMTARLGRHRGKDGGSTDESALFGIPLVEGYTATGWDLYRIGDGDRCRRDARGEPHGSHNGLCALAIGEKPELVLDRFVPDWRTRFWTDYEVFLASDDNLSTRRKPGLR
jgi:hypothetical protein